MLKNAQRWLHVQMYDKAVDTSAYILLGDNTFTCQSWCVREIADLYLNVYYELLHEKLYLFHILAIQTCTKSNEKKSILSFKRDDRHKDTRTEKLRQGANNVCEGN